MFHSPQSALWQYFMKPPPLACLATVTLSVRLWKMFMGQAPEKDRYLAAGAALCAAICPIFTC